MAKMSIPEGLDVLQLQEGIVIRRVWRSWIALPLCFFLVFWFGILGFMYYGMFTSRHTPPFIFFIPLFHVAAGLGLAYYVISTLLNQTDIIISPSNVKCTTGPIPWPGNLEVPATGVHGAVVRERNSGRRANSMTFTVMYVDASNRERKLLSGLPHREQADFIAASIEQILGLPQPA